MFKITHHFLLAFAAPLALGLGTLPVAPLAAQDEATEQAGENLFDGIFGALAGMFEKEPLTAEQQARLPMATRLINKVLPEGALADVMGGSMGGMFGAVDQFAGEIDVAEIVAKQLGINRWAIDLEGADLEKVAGMLDPAWRERQQREKEAMPALMAEVMKAVEPTMREAMAELYAIYFDDKELADIDAFFSTPSGANYARKSFSMANDPRLAASMMSAMPAMMGLITGMEARLEEATADLPAKRKFEDLPASQQIQLAKMFGKDIVEMKEWMEFHSSTMTFGGFDDHEDEDHHDHD
jgi:hypothetical protein